MLTCTLGLGARFVAGFDFGLLFFWDLLKIVGMTWIWTTLERLFHSTCFELRQQHGGIQDVRSEFSTE